MLHGFSNIIAGSFYPIFPVPLDAAHDVNLDISHSETLNLCEKEETAPDILILPSKLKQFVKVSAAYDAWNDG